jgi:hypothetical protein
MLRVLSAPGVECSGCRMLQLQVLNAEVLNAETPELAAAVRPLRRAACRARGDGQNQRGARYNPRHDGVDLRRARGGRRCRWKRSTLGWSWPYSCFGLYLFDASAVVCGGLICRLQSFAEIRCGSPPGGKHAPVGRSGRFGRLLYWRRCLLGADGRTE